MREVVVSIPPTFTLDDVLLVPAYSEIEHRSECDVSTRIGLSVRLDIPLIASCMDTVCDLRMAGAMAKLGGLGIIHRYMSNSAQIAQAVAVGMDNEHVAVAIGIKDIEHARALARVGVDIICIDVAHGHHKLVGDFVNRLVAEELFPTIIAGNVCTGEGALFLAEAGADAIRVGIGSGSICRTREVTGHGAPLLWSVRECKAAVGDKASIIADGGIRSSGDIVKCLAFGADAVMLGSMLSGTDETPNPLLYRGMASRAAQEEFYETETTAPEGVTFKIEPKGPVADVVKRIVGGICSGMSYSGVRTINELRFANFQYLTNAGRIESNLGTYSSIR